MATQAHDYVLIVDDDEATRVTLARVLRADGVDVWCTSDGAEALDVLRWSSPPALVLLELGMPHVSGWEVIDRIEHNPKWHDIPVLILTAATGPDDLPEHRPGLHKPIDGPVLVDMVHRLMHSPASA